MASVEEKRLESYQSALKAQGVKDVKFCFSHNSEKPLSVLAKDVADVLELVVAGGLKDFPALNDNC